MPKIILLLLLVVSFISCDSNRFFDSYQSISNGWSKERPISFTLEEHDSLTPYNVFITLRNNNAYAYNNLFLITTLQYPNGKKEIDTLEYVMAAPDGRWLGQGFSDVKESKLWYREGLRFRESGPYTITIAQAVRKNGNVEGDERLQGITDVGLRVETVNTK